MKNIIIIGAGTGGTMIANKLYKALDKKEWQITIIDPSEIHYYQPGFLFIPFGIYSKKDVEKPTKKFLPKKINFICSEVDSINPLDNTVILKNQNVLSYDYLFVSSGTRLSPEDTPGLKDKLWQVDIFEFYTAEGAIALGQKLKNFKGGKLVMSIVDLPFKCPIAPIEFVCLADEYLKKKGIREKTEIIYVTPLSGAFTKPIASKMLNNLLLSKNIKIVPDFYIEKIDNDNKKLISYDGRDVPFDLLVIVPLNKGADFIEKSGLGDELNFVPVNMHTLQVEKHPNIFVLGDAAAIPTSKAGSVVHFAGEIVFKNFMSIIKNKNIIHSIAQSVMLDFFRSHQMLDFIVLDGNHDLSGKGEDVVSALKSLDNEPNVRRIYEPTMIENMFIVPYSDNMIDIIKKNSSKYLISHFGLNEATFNSGVSIVSDISIKDLVGKYRYVLLGHYHKPQEIIKDDIEIYYTGSITQNDWGEKGEEKRFLVVDTETDSIKSVPTIGYKKFFDFQITNENKEDIIKKARQLKEEGHSVKITKKEEVNLADISEEFVVIDKTEKDITNRGVNSTMSMRDKLSRYVEINGIPEEKRDIYLQEALSIINSLSERK